MIHWILLTCTAITELCVLRRLRFDWLTIAIVLAGTVMCVDYLTYTSISERNYDGPLHLEYIQSIAQHLRLPDVFACGACGHPPLYYALAALWSKVVLVGEWMPIELGLQWLSLLLFFGFVVFALLILRSCSMRPKTLRLATALIVFWPSSIINSVRLHNDALASFLMLGAMYFTARWDGQGRTRDFYAALTASALALLTKSSGYAVATTLVFFAILRLCSIRLDRESIKQCATAVLVIAGVAVLAVGLRESWTPTTLCQKVLGHACDGRYVPAVVDKPTRFIYFDAPDFVRRIDALPDHPERDYFLNRLAKSSLFGVIPLGDEFSSRRHKTLSVLISLLLLSMVTVCVVALPIVRVAHFRKYRAYVVAAVSMLVFLVAFRVRAPNEFHEDFRHIFPALVPFCLGYAIIVERLGRFSKLAHHAGVAIGLSMVAASVAFFARIP
jgi:hypothetical protein